MTLPETAPQASNSEAGKRRLIIHIGDHKTGTTSIQNTFAAGRVRLDGHSLLYPAAMAHNYLRPHVESFAKGNPLETRHADQPGLADLGAQIRDAGADFTVISAEEFEGIDPLVLQQVLKTYFTDAYDEIRIVAYVRPHAARVLSTYAEEIKIGQFKGLPEDYHEITAFMGRFLFAPRFKAWRKVFGDNFVLRPMVRDRLAEGSVLHDFIRTSCGDVDFAIEDSDNHNESLCLEDLVLLRLAQEQLAKRKWGVRHAFGWELAHQLNALPRPAGKTRLEMHRALAEQIRKEYRDDARTMDTEFFGGEPILEAELDKSLAKALPEAQSLRPKDHFSPDEIHTLKATAALLADLLGQPGANWALHFRDERVKAIRDPG